ncbi:MAG: M43 family zinc metalloprotease [Bacteroidota bacterium]
MKKLILFFTFVSSAVISFGQQQDHKTCGHTAVTRELWAKNPQLKTEYETMIKNLLKNSKKTVQNKTAIYTIPIVFHIIHEYGTENITDAQVYDQVDILNRDYNKLNADTNLVVPEFQDLIADVKIQFKLPAYDYKGDCTNGIEHINSHETNNGDDFSKIHQWDRNMYLNVWVVNSMRDGVAGYAYYPSDIGFGNSFADGVIILNDYIGSIGTSDDYSSRALTHEIGHYLGLSHTWGSTNDPEVGCGDDGVADTPLTAGHNNCSPSILFDYECDTQEIDTVYNFSTVTLTSGMSDTMAPTVYSASLDTTAIILTDFRAVGVSANSEEDSVFAFNNWGTGAANGELVFANLTGSINTAKYYEFTVDPEFGQAMSLASITFDVGRDTSGIRTFAVRSSINNFASNIGSASITPSNGDLSVQAGNVFFYKKDTTTMETGSKITLTTGYTSLTSPVTFRIYGWNSEDASGTFVVDNVSIDGTYGTVENVQNYMEYSYCSYMFTHDQAEIMIGTINTPESYRDLLVSDSTANFTGINLNPKPLCVPVADFSANFRTACVNDAVTFEDASWNAVIDNRTWYFQDGSPATSTSATPVVNFATSGWKTVKLVVQNATGADSLEVENYIYVSANNADFVGPHSEGFDGAFSNWIIENPENNMAKWEFTPNYGNYNSPGFMIQNYYEEPSSGPISDDEDFYNDRLGGSTDALISPSFDLSTSSNLVLSFNYAYATKATLEEQVTEELNVYVSKNCGKTWILRKTLSGAELLSAGSFSYDFKPTSTNFWKNCMIDLAGTVNATDTKTRFKFEFVASDNSNNIFIDNINLYGVLGDIDNPLTKMNLMVYPNPVSKNADLNVSFYANESDVTFELYNVNNQVLVSKTCELKNQHVELDLLGSKTLAAGCYFLKVTQGKNQRVEKVIIQ